MGNGEWPECGGGGPSLGNIRSIRSGQTLQHWVDTVTQRHWQMGFGQDACMKVVDDTLVKIMELCEMRAIYVHLYICCSID